MKYKVTSPSGESFIVTAPDNATQDEILSYAQNSFQQPQMGLAEGRAKAALTGANTLLPGLAGLPVDTVTNLINMGIAGYGVAKNKLTGSKELPSPIENPVMGSQWISNKLNEAASAATGQNVDLFSNPLPNDPVAQMSHTAAPIALSGALVPSASLPEAAANVARMVPSAVGAAVGQQAAPNEPLAPVIGSMVAPGAMAAKSAITRQPSLNVDLIKTAQKAGYRIPPGELGKNKVLSSIGGKASLRQSASFKNQDVTNNLIKKDVGIPKDTPITSESLKAVREKAGNAYDAVKNSGVRIKVTPKYLEGVRSLGGDFKAAAQEFPDLLKNAEVEKLITSLNKPEFSVKSAVELSKFLRKNATRNLKSFDNPERVALGSAQRDAANLMENLVGENLKAAGKGNLASDWNKSRTLIAKTHDAETAFDGSSNIDARVYARLLGKGAPLTGNAKLVGEFATNFPFAAQPGARAGAAGVSALNAAESALFGGGGYAIGGPAGASAAMIPLAAPPLARGYLLGRPFGVMGPGQRNLTPRPYETPAGLYPSTALLPNRK